MFPSDFIENNTIENSTENTGCDFLFDYKTGQHIMNNSVLVECTVLQSVKQYIQNVLRTQMNAYGVYTEGEDEAFGISIYNYLGERKLPMGYLNSELKREVVRQLTMHPLIEGVSGWKGKRARQGLDIEFTVTLTDGSILNIAENISMLYSAPADTVPDEPVPVEPTPVEPVPEEPVNDNTGELIGEIEIYGFIADDIVGTAAAE